jgi:hypothetical protein
MEKSKIKQKLKNFLEDFKREIGGFKSQEVIYNYVSFLNSEKYTKELLKDMLLYAEEQKKKLLLEASKVKDFDIVIDPNNLAELSVFEREQKASKDKIKNKDHSFDVYDAMPIMLTYLIMIYDFMDSIKNNKFSESLTQIEGLEVSDLLRNSKSEAMGFHVIKVLPDKSAVIQNTKLYGASIELINKFVIDQIDSEEFLNRRGIENKIGFDKNRSVLIIHGKEIKIQRKADKPNDHFVLEYLFEQDDIFNEADFADIAKTKLGLKEYDGERDWNKLRHACDRLNDKVGEKFLVYHTGKTGWCKISPKYM